MFIIFELMKSICDTEFIIIKSVENSKLIEVSIKKPGSNQGFLYKTYRIFKLFNFKSIKYIDSSQLYFIDLYLADYIHINMKSPKYLNLKNLNGILKYFGDQVKHNSYRYFNIENIYIYCLFIKSDIIKCSYYTANNHYDNDHITRYFIPMLKIC